MWVLSGGSRTSGFQRGANCERSDMDTLGSLPRRKAPRRKGVGVHRQSQAEARNLVPERSSVSLDCRTATMTPNKPFHLTPGLGPSGRPVAAGERPVGAVI